MRVGRVTREFSRTTDSSTRKRLTVNHPAEQFVDSLTRLGTLWGHEAGAPAKPLGRLDPLLPPTPPREGGAQFLGQSTDNQPKDSPNVLHFTNIILQFILHLCFTFDQCKNGNLPTQTKRDILGRRKVPPHPPPPTPTSMLGVRAPLRGLGPGGRSPRRRGGCRGPRQRR